MKYRVVGWTDYDGDDAPDSESPIGFAERHAIVDDIKKNGYLFSGWDHQERWGCTPVLNDGKKRCFSQRGWGGVMAEAHGETEPYAYARYTFMESIAKPVLPRGSYTPCYFTPETELAEHLSLAVDGETLARARGQNPILLPDAPALRYLDAGDTLTLTDDGDALTVLVTGVDRRPANEEDGVSTSITLLVKHGKGKG